MAAKLTTVPVEILTMILQHIDLKDIWTLKQVSRAYHELFTSLTKLVLGKCWFAQEMTFEEKEKSLLSHHTGRIWPRLPYKCHRISDLVLCGDRIAFVTNKKIHLLDMKTRAKDVFNEDVDDLFLSEDLLGGRRQSTIWYFDGKMRYINVWLSGREIVGVKVWKKKIAISYSGHPGCVAVYDTESETSAVDMRPDCSYFDEASKLVQSGTELLIMEQEKMIRTGVDLGGRVLRDVRRTDTGRWDLFHIDRFDEVTPMPGENLRYLSLIEEETYRIEKMPKNVVLWRNTRYTSLRDGIVVQRGEHERVLPIEGVDRTMMDVNDKWLVRVDNTLNMGVLSIFSFVDG